jgi:hypothetical protein
MIALVTLRVLNGNGEQSEPSLNRSDGFPEKESVPFFCEVPHSARNDGV